MKTDPFGNQPGTIRGILALFFAAAMAAIVLAFVYRTEILSLPFVMPDAFTISFFTLGGTVIGSYFGIRAGQSSLAVATATTTTSVSVPTEPTPTTVNVPVIMQPTAVVEPVAVIEPAPHSDLLSPAVQLTTSEEHLAAS